MFRLASLLASVLFVIALSTIRFGDLDPSVSGRTIDSKEVHDESAGDEFVVRGDRRKQSDDFSNIELETQFGDTVRFYDDLVRDKAVIVNFFYTTCAKTCPGTSARLAAMYDELEPWMGRDLTMISISIDPAVDRPDRLKEYWEVFGSKPGWLMLTGDEDEIDLLRRQMGVYDLDPVVDADKTQHAGILTFGNDRTDRWAALPVFMHQEHMLETILQTTREADWRTPRSRRSQSVIAVADAQDLFRGSGVVRAIYPDRGQLLVEHGAIPGLMAAMTMLFEVAESRSLDGLEEGDSIDFTLRRVDGAHQIQSWSIVETRTSGAVKGDAQRARTEI
jgi:protein SCO1/2